MMAGKIHILLVDDEAIIRDNPDPLLERNGFRVTTAMSGDEALRKLADSPPDVVVMDVMMSHICGDYAFLLLAIHNILNNTIKYSVEGDDIRLCAAPINDQLRISIIDTGPGIAAEDLPYVCDELYRSTNNRSVNGSGVGLALVKRIVERHHGSISIESELNRGTTINLMLPETCVSESE